MPVIPPLPPALRVAIDRAATDAPWYVVGGYVRDGLLGRAPADLDIVVAADAAVIARRIGNALGGSPFALGADHGVHRVTLRAPVDGIDHIDVSAPRGSIEHDLSLRDFTINAIAWQPGAGALVDPHDGSAACRERTLRLVSDRAVQDDPLRALRAVRLAAELGCRVESDTAAVIRRDAALLARSAGERQRDELARVLDTPVAMPMLRLADQLGLLDVLLPELIPGKGCVQPKEHYYEVFDHNVETVGVLDSILHAPAPASAFAVRHHRLWDGLPEADEIRARLARQAGEGRTHRSLLKLTGLLHDVAKPQTRRMHDGRVRFFGHDEIGAGVATAIMERLRYTARETKLVALLIADHLRPGQIASPGHEPSRRALYRFFRDLGEAVPDLLLLNLADHAAARGPEMSDEAWAGHVGYIRWILSRRSRDEDLVQPRRLITGHDLMRELGLPPGPLIGRLLDEISEAGAVGQVRTREQALDFARRRTAPEG